MSTDECRLNGARVVPTRSAPPDIVSLDASKITPLPRAADWDNPRSYETTLAAVRELSEKAMLRPAPRILRCLPFQARPLLKPVPLWKRQMIQLSEAAELISHSSFVISQ